MSAWIVPKAHIDVLVNGLVGLGLTPLSQADEVGQDLWEENHRSVNHRYRESTPTPTYRFVRARLPIHHLHLVAAEECYEYQSNEHPGWKDSTAHARCKALLAIIESRWPGAFEEYNKAPITHDGRGPGVRWGYQRLSYAHLPIH